MRPGESFSSKCCWWRDPRLLVVLMLRFSFRFRLFGAMSRDVLAAALFNRRGDCFFSTGPDEACRPIARKNMMASDNVVGDAKAPIEERRRFDARECMNGRSNVERRKAQGRVKLGRMGGVDGNHFMAGLVDRAKIIGTERVRM